VETFYSQHEVFGIREKPVEAALLQNPVTKGSMVRIQGLKDNLSYQLNFRDLSGKNIIDRTIGYNEIIAIPVNMPAGIYMLRVTSTGEPVMFQKILVIN
jgi:hypothetical protein